jgi:hypothetical protein
MGELDKYFDDFMRLYESNKINLSWRKNSYAFNLREKVDNEKEFRDFIAKLANTLRKKYIKNMINDEYKEYEKYVDILVEYDPEIIADLITRCESNINICNNVSYEILTKRNEELEPQFYSVLLNLNLLKPNLGADLLEQINFELSIKDLRLFYKLLGEAIENIEKLSKANLE